MLEYVFFKETISLWRVPLTTPYLLVHIESVNTKEMKQRWSLGKNKSTLYKVTNYVGPTAHHCCVNSNKGTNRLAVESRTVLLASTHFLEFF